MNYRLLCKLLGVVTILIGGTMVASLPWAIPALGHRHIDAPATELPFELAGFLALLVSMLISLALGGGLYYFGRRAEGTIFRKEAMAVVGLSWFMATFLGALPFYLCGLGGGLYRSAAVRQFDDDVGNVSFSRYNRSSALYSPWKPVDSLKDEQAEVLAELLQAGARGLSAEELQEACPDGAQVIAQLRESSSDWKRILLIPGSSGPANRKENYRIAWIRMTFADSLFESQSGFSTTGATVLADLEDPYLVPHCILFWRSSTHFLGGLGIIVLFVAVLGQGSAGKALMRAEMPGPSKDGAQTRMQHTAWTFAAIYLALNIMLTLLLKVVGGAEMTWFDALCHAFGTLATGGFSTYNKSLGHFNSAAIEYLVILFMILAGTNFTLIYFLVIRRPKRMLGDLEWRTYMAIIFGGTVLVVFFGGMMVQGDFTSFGRFAEKTRHGLFQVVAILTTTGYGTHDFDQWNSLGRGFLFLLMFIGGCAGSTGGGMKVIRHILFLKILGLEVEQAYHPNVVRPLRIGGEPVDDPSLKQNVLVYFGLVLVIFVFSWMAIVALEPETTWGNDPTHKLIDSASGVAATLNNIGPGLGTVGATQNYGHFSPFSKLLFTWLMMLGRVEIFVILVIFIPGFWRDR